MYTRKVIIFLIGCSLLFGCGTFKTIAPKDNHVSISHNGKKSHCLVIPRIYSGTSYGICKMSNGESSYSVKRGYIFNSKNFFIIDIPFSFLADTIVLPYTAFKQYQLGNIPVI